MRRKARLSARAMRKSGALSADCVDEVKADCRVMVPAYDHETLWEGHGSMVNEMYNQLGSKPDAIFCSVGGAGLLGGLIVGSKDVGWDDGGHIEDNTLVLSAHLSPLLHKIQFPLLLLQREVPIASITLCLAMATGSTVSTKSYRLMSRSCTTRSTM